MPLTRSLSPRQLADLVSALLLTPEAVGELDEAQGYGAFVTGIAAVIAQHCGGTVVVDAHQQATEEGGAPQWRVKIANDPCVPDPDYNAWTYIERRDAAAAVREMECYWVVSTAHLTPAERARLVDRANYQLASEDSIADLGEDVIADLADPMPGEAYLVAACRYGWMIRLPEIDARSLSQPIAPVAAWPGLSAVLEAARADGIGRVRFDADADVIPSLPAFSG